ncbi:plasmid partitioning protein RepB [Agrobacterium sp. AGB01]|uniref:plasmid partitioning protein RepB n=1 Tax=Agrobacterium sp. AGB01 TaxID=2769302 RepID=UPI0017824AED|nr:plasmid partitioning protein RepB [Agrobacterium sp. AGB01]MBD9388026.1 plasmid partitioning protein RepB [Agrobacterium sp. AGB01]
MSKGSRKSIVASFGLLSAELENHLKGEVSAPAVAPQAANNRVGAGVIGAAHRAIDDIRAERDRLKALVEAGGGSLLMLDTAVVDPSPYPDRLPEDDPDAFQAFKTSIETEGQKVPIQVRKHPTAAGRYQIVYGHRRWLAAKELGKPVQAMEVDISDLDLVVAQGIENASRQDLSWIERALFASRMDMAGIKPRDIYAALSIDDAELARMRGVYRTVPADVIEAIGRAPKIGRPRWVDFAKRISANKNALELIRKTLADGGGKLLTSDKRFQNVLEAIKPTVTEKAPTEILDANGDRLVALNTSAKEVRISAEDQLGKEFIKFVAEQLPTLVEQFSLQRAKKNN